MPVPQFVVDLRARIGHDPLWLIGVNGRAETRFEWSGSAAR